VALNHRIIANIHGSLNTFIGQQRERYFIEAMSENDLTVLPEHLVSGEMFTKEDGYRAMKALLKAKTQPTAVVCASDMLAIGAIQAIHEAGKSVPKDYSLVGFDGIDVGQLISPRLTTIKQDTDKMGQEAAKSILKMVKAKKRIKKGETVSVETDILEGETTKSL